MRCVVQRVTEASITVGGARLVTIGKGLAVLVGVSREDEERDLEWMAKRIAHLRIFPDAEGKMNLAPSMAGAEILLVSQFTLCANVRKGNRPSFAEAMEPNQAEAMMIRLADAISDYGLQVKTGKFGAHMMVSLVNDGPVTIILDSRLRV